jgi:hypothetical protein
MLIEKVPTSRSSKRERGDQNPDKSSKLTRMLVAISLSFVLFHLPYFVSWCVFINFRINNLVPGQPLSSHVIKQMVKLFSYVKMGEILNLFNYSISGFLYFATGKVFIYFLVPCRISLLQCIVFDENLVKI